VEAQDTGYESKTFESFGRQVVMQTLEAELSIQGAGIVSIRFPFQSQFTQQNGYIHAGIVATILDSACGYAAFTLMPQGADVLTVEFKVNLLRPAKGDNFVAKATVVKPGKTISVVEAALYSSEYGEEKPVATMTATIMTMLQS
jgi:uncharacterized protein (TIGR00369 family)